MKFHSNIIRFMTFSVARLLTQAPILRSRITFSFQTLFVIGLLLSVTGCSNVLRGIAHPFQLSGMSDNGKILIFTKTAEFRHESIPAAVDAIKTLAENNGLQVDTTEDSNAFTEENLKNYKAVLFVSTTGDVLNDQQQDAFAAYIKGGGGFMGVHAAADTEKGWEWYSHTLLGAKFVTHPAPQQATVKVADHVHPSTKDLPENWVRFDEWYEYDVNPRGSAHILATLDEKTYSRDGVGSPGTYDHAIAWCKAVDSGRSWYTGMGHTVESYQEDEFLHHLAGGLKWVTGIEEGDCGATIPSQYVAREVDTNTFYPMQLSIAEDGRVIYIQRTGKVRLWNPSTGSSDMIGQISVTTDREDGLLGVAFDPEFTKNNWIYFYYSVVDKSVNRLSRFTLNNGQLDLGSELPLLEVPSDRDVCCHVAGGLAFGPNRTLYLATGDNTDPFQITYGPTNENPGQAKFDAQRTAANTNDLRGKILRIIPPREGEASYSIPDGNLFPVGTPKTRPEIYVMGVRNPFRLSVDPVSGWLYWGDVGPDAGEDSRTQGSRGYDEVNQAREAGNFGWPYFVGHNSPYCPYALAITGACRPEDFYNDQAPVNNSPNNTGLNQLPPAKPAWVWYPHSLSDVFPELGVSHVSTVIVGGVYRYNSNLKDPMRLPPYFDNTLFFGDFSRSWIKEAKIGGDASVFKINPFEVADARGEQIRDFIQPIDIKIGPDGHMYLLEWGSENDPQRFKLVRIDYLGAQQRPPVAKVSSNLTSGGLPLTVQFSSKGSFDPETETNGDAGSSGLVYAWDFNGDGVIDSTDANPSYTYTAGGSYQVKLQVSKARALQSHAAATLDIVAGNQAPKIDVQWPPMGGIFEYGLPIHYSFQVEDADGTVDLSRAYVLPATGHDAHEHDYPSSIPGLSGVAIPEANGEVLAGANVFFVLKGRYTDEGHGVSRPITSESRIVLQPKRKQAEYYSQISGSQLQDTDDQGGGKAVAFIDDGHWISFKPLNLANINGIKYRVASAGRGGRIEVHVDAPTGPMISTVDIPVTGDWQQWIDVNASVSDPGGTHELFFVFRDPQNFDPESLHFLFNLNWIEFQGAGVN